MAQTTGTIHLSPLAYPVFVQFLCLLVFCTCVRVCLLICVLPSVDGLKARSGLLLLRPLKCLSCLYQIPPDHLLIICLPAFVRPSLFLDFFFCSSISLLPFFYFYFSIRSPLPTSSSYVCLPSLDHPYFSISFSIYLFPSFSISLFLNCFYQISSAQVPTSSSYFRRPTLENLPCYQGSSVDDDDNDEEEEEKRRGRETPAVSFNMY